MSRRNTRLRLDGAASSILRGSVQRSTFFDLLLVVRCYACSFPAYLIAECVAHLNLNLGAAATWQAPHFGMSVDTPGYRFHNRKEAKIPLTARTKSLDHTLEEAVSRALRDNLAPLQRTADELHHAYADLVAACASSRPSNALPALLRAQTSASALAAGLSVLSNFVAVALSPREHHFSDEPEPIRSSIAVEEPPPSAGVHPAPPEPEVEWVEEPEDVPEPTAETASRPSVVQHPPAREPEPISESDVEEAAIAATEAFDVASLPAEMQDLHRRANRVAKVAMQDIKLLRPKDVRVGREHKDICSRLRSDLDKARKEYDRRFRAIHEHPVDYFRHWLVEILADGDPEALGEYPYPSPVLRH
jgi:hypothetical protein